MRLRLFFLLFLFSVSTVSVAKLPPMKKYSPAELLDSIQVGFGVDVTIPKSCDYYVLEDWVNVVSEKDLLHSISLYNGVIRGKKLVAFIRPVPPINAIPATLETEAFFISDRHFYGPYRKKPADFNVNDYITRLPANQAQRLYNADKVSYMPVRSGYKWFEPWASGRDYGIQQLYESEYHNMAIYYFEKDTRIRFDVVVLWSDGVRHPERQILRFLSRIISYE